VGKDGKTIDVIKIKTMKSSNNSIEFNSITIDGDSRITKSGKFLRKYKIDEYHN